MEQFGGAENPAGLIGAGRQPERTCHSCLWHRASPNVPNADQGPQTHSYPSPLLQSRHTGNAPAPLLDQRPHTGTLGDNRSRSTRLVLQMHRLKAELSTRSFVHNIFQHGCSKNASAMPRCDFPAVKPAAGCCGSWGAQLMEGTPSPWSCLCH